MQKYPFLFEKSLLWFPIKTPAVASCVQLNQLDIEWTNIIDQSACSHHLILSDVRVSSGGDKDSDLTI